MFWALVVGCWAAVLVGFHPERNEFYFVDLDCRSPLRRSVSCATAAAVTWALYQATPLRKAAPAAPAPGKP